MWHGPSNYEYEFEDYSDRTPFRVRHILFNGRPLCNTSGFYQSNNKWHRRCKRCERSKRKDLAKVKTVQEFFEADKIFKDDVARIADESSYWESSANFVLQKWDEDMDRLSEKQATWLGKIQEDMVERRIKGKL